MSKKQKVWIILSISVVAIIAVVLVFISIRSQQSSSTASYQTTTVQKGTLTSAVEGTGTVASTQSTTLNWDTSGQVDQVLAQTGTQVRTGDVLATLLQDLQARTALETNLVNAQKNLAELTSPEAIANARLDITTAESNVQKAKYSVYQQQNWKNDALIRDKYAAVVIAKEKLDNVQEAYDKAHVGEYINNTREAILVQDLYNAQQAYNIAYNQYSAYSQKPTQRQIDEAQANLDLANAQLASAQNYLAALTGGDVPADATGTSLLKFKEATLAVETAQEDLEAIKLTAPFDGTITRVDVITNAIVSAGTQAFRIDDLSSLVVAVQVTEIDINSIQNGQPAAITFDAIPNKTYIGKVIKSDLAGSSSANSVNFTVTVELTNADAQVKPGMSANVTVTTNQVDNALLVPSTAIFTDSSGQQYVYLIRNGIASTVTVTTGAVSDSSTQIFSDSLQEGDVIVLSFTSTSTTSSGGFVIGGIGGLFGGGGERVQPPSNP